METPTPTAAPRRGSPLDTIAGILTIAIVLTTIFLAWPFLLAQFQERLGYAPQATPAAPTSAPTLAPDQRAMMQQAAPQTSAEGQALRQAVPTIAPVAPVGSTPAPVNSPAPARAFSPIDLGDAPLPTPTSGLTSAQLDASAASEEQNQLNTALSGLTPAQEAVRQHDAEWEIKEELRQP